MEEVVNWRRALVSSNTTLVSGSRATAQFQELIQICELLLTSGGSAGHEGQAVCHHRRDQPTIGMSCDSSRPSLRGCGGLPEDKYPGALETGTAPFHATPIHIPCHIISPSIEIVVPNPPQTTPPGHCVGSGRRSLIVTFTISSCELTPLTTPSPRTPRSFSSSLVCAIFLSLN